DPLSDDGNEHLDGHLYRHNDPDGYDDGERDFTLADVRLTRMSSGRRPSGCEDYVHRGYHGERIHARRGSHLREQRSGDLRYGDLRERRRGRLTHVYREVLARHDGTSDDYRNLPGRQDSLRKCRDVPAERA